MLLKWRVCFQMHVCNKCWTCHSFFWWKLHHWTSQRRFPTIEVDQCLPLTTMFSHEWSCFKKHLQFPSIKLLKTILEMYWTLGTDHVFCKDAESVSALRCCEYFAPLSFWFWHSFGLPCVRPFDWTNLWSSLVGCADTEVESQIYPREVKQIPSCLILHVVCHFLNCYWISLF